MENQPKFWCRIMISDYLRQSKALALKGSKDEVKRPDGPPNINWAKLFKL